MPQLRLAHADHRLRCRVYHDEGATGTIEISQTPDVLAGAGWSLTGPSNRSGSGATTLLNMPVGLYTLIWEAVEGHITPQNEEQILAAGEIVVFSGAYSLSVAGFQYVGSLNGHDYYLSDYLVSWAEARDDCLAAGGHLATITSGDENELVTAAASLASGWRVWIGFTDEPNDNGGEDYCILYGDQTASPGSWNDTTGIGPRHIALEIE